MSFTTVIKNEISNNFYSASETMAELSAILNVVVNINNKSFKLFTENISVARHIYKLIKEIYHVEIVLKTNEYNTLRNNKLVSLEVFEKYYMILNDLSIIENDKRKYVPKEFIYESEEDKKAYLRGIFMICGSINDPKKSRYHAEFVINNRKTAIFVNDLLNSMNFNSKCLKREKSYMVYIKESEKISDFIKMLNATNALFYYEDIRIYRDHKNMTNRWNNCEQANVDKIINTSNEQLEMIKKLKETLDFELLDDKIKEVSIYKEKYPESSLTELANIISLETGRTITKSGINHRFRKIKEMLDKIRKD